MKMKKAKSVPRYRPKDMSDSELVAACCDVIVWMLTKLAVSHQVCKRIYAVIPKAELEPHGESVHQTMNVLGDLMNAHDSVEAEDGWTDEYFREMQRRFPIQKGTDS